MRKDFQKVQRDSLIDEIVDLVEYAESELTIQEDEYGKRGEVNVNWADENIVRMSVRCALSMKGVHFKHDEKTEAIAEKIFDLVRDKDRKDLMCFTFGLMMNRMTRSDIRHMIGYAREMRDLKRLNEAAKKMEEK